MGGDEKVIILAVIGGVLLAILVPTAIHHCYYHHLYYGELIEMRREAEARGYGEFRMPPDGNTPVFYWKEGREPE